MARLYGAASQPTKGVILNNADKLIEVQNERIRVLKQTIEVMQEILDAKDERIRSMEKLNES